LEIEDGLGAVRAPTDVGASATKGKFKSAESRRKKNEEKRKNLGETKT